MHLRQEPVRWVMVADGATYAPGALRRDHEVAKRVKGYFASVASRQW